ncbi:Ribonuclease_H-like superfamily [Hexamita inflata]|uniref:Ribonuclease_H-like superfamily n=1 Tax=Hexamita inflata TaxID=28002 RepID=A0ABP1I8T4_9EUKA
MNTLNELSARFRVTETIRPNIMIDISSLNATQMSQVQNKLQKPDFIQNFEVPFRYKNISSTCVLFQFDHNNKFSYLKKPFVQEKMPQIGGVPSTLERSVTFVKFPNVGMTIGMLASQMDQIAQLDLTRVLCVIDFEMYDGDVVSEVSLHFIQNNQVIEEVHMLVKLDETTHMNQQSVHFVLKHVTGIDPNEIPTNAPTNEEFRKKFKEMHEKHNPIYFAKGIDTEKRMIAQIIGKECEIFEVVALCYLQKMKLPIMSEIDRLNKQMKCDYHKKLNGKFHCAKQDCAYYVEILTE